MSDLTLIVSLHSKRRKFFNSSHFTVVWRL